MRLSHDGLRASPRRVLLLAASGLLTAAGCGGDGGTGPGKSGIPTNAVYRIQMQGRTEVGGVQNSVWTQPGQVVIEPTVDALDASHNGINPVDVGVFTDASPIIGAAGAFYFATNTSLTSRVASSLGTTATDVAFVSVGPASGAIHIRVDGSIFGVPNARLNVLNIYNVLGGVTAQIHNVLSGTIELRVSDGGRTIDGTIQVGGNSGFAGPAITSAYVAQFTGTRTN